MKESAQQGKCVSYIRDGGVYREMCIYSSEHHPWEQIYAADLGRAMEAKGLICANDRTDVYVYTVYIYI